MGGRTRIVAGFGILSFVGVSLFLGCGTDCPHVDRCIEVEYGGCPVTTVVESSAETVLFESVSYAFGATVPDQSNDDLWTPCRQGRNGACVAIGPCEVGAGTLHLRAEGYELGTIMFTLIKDADSDAGGCRVSGCHRVLESELTVSLEAID